MHYDMLCILLSRSHSNAPPGINFKVSSKLPQGKGNRNMSPPPGKLGTLIVFGWFNVYQRHRQKQVKRALFHENEASSEDVSGRISIETPVSEPPVAVGQLRSPNQLLRVIVIVRRRARSYQVHVTLGHLRHSKQSTVRDPPNKSGTTFSKIATIRGTNS